MLLIMISQTDFEGKIYSNLEGDIVFPHLCAVVAVDAEASVQPSG